MARRLMRIALVTGLAGHVLPAPAPVIPPLARLLRVPTRMDHSFGVAITFDDGPHPRGTTAVLELLDLAGAPATFFLVGEQVARAPALAAEIAAAGHEVAIHCQRHRNLLRLAPWQVHDDLRRAADVIQSATGRTPRLYRPPYGILTGSALVIARRNGWQPLLWSRWGRDWSARATPDSITAKVTERLRPGDVLLLHDADHYSSRGSWRDTVAALPGVLEEVERRGLKPVAIS